MKLYILRHGEAEASAPSDAERRLTSGGRQQLSVLLGRVKSRLADVELLLASPYVRAQQTAALVSESLGLPIETCAALVPAGSVSGVIQQLEQQTENEILLVSHQPLVGELASDLCGKPQGYYHMPTGNLICIELDPIAAGCGEMAWVER